MKLKDAERKLRELHKQQERLQRLIAAAESRQDIEQLQALDCRAYELQTEQFKLERQFIEALQKEAK